MTGQVWMWTVLSTFSYGELTTILLKHKSSIDSFNAREGQTFLSQRPIEKLRVLQQICALCFVWYCMAARCYEWVTMSFCLLILQIAMDVRESAELIYLSFRLKCPWCDHSYFDDIPLLELWLWLGWTGLDGLVNSILRLSLATNSRLKSLASVHFLPFFSLLSSRVCIQCLTLTIITALPLLLYYTSICIAL